MKRIVIIVCLAALSLSAQAQMVGATNRQNGSFSPSNNDPVYRPTGTVLQFEMGYPFAVSVGYQMNSSVMVGGGIGFNPREAAYSTCYQRYNDFAGCYETREDWVTVQSLPIFVEARFSTPRYRWSLFADFKLGVSVGLFSVDELHEGALYEKVNPIFMSGQVGVTYKRLSFSIGCGYNPALLRLNNWSMVPETYSYVCPIVSLSYQLSIDKLRSVFF